MAEQRLKRIPIGVIAIATGVLAAGGAGAWWALHSNNSNTPPIVTQTIQPPSPNNPAPPIQQSAAVYWLQDTGTNLKLTPTQITVNTREPKAVLEAAFEQLLAGPSNTSVSSTIPQGTKLRSVRVQNDGIHVDLSTDFISGGGSASMSGRLAQVIYTATSLDPNAKVWIDVEGKRLEYLGGEGLELEQPLTRQSFQENFTL